MIQTMSNRGVIGGFYGLRFEAPLEDLAEGFQGDSDRFTMLWMVYEEGYYEGQMLRETLHPALAEGIIQRKVSA